MRTFFPPFVCSFVLVIGVLVGCKPELPETPQPVVHPPEAPPPNLIAPTVEVGDSDPLEWPVTLPLDAQGRAMPRKTAMIRPAENGWGGLVASLAPQSRYIQGSGHRGPWHHIVRPPRGAGKGASPSPQHDVKRNGERQEWDSADGLSQWNKDGSFDHYGKDGSHTHMHGPGGKDGKYGYRESRDGTRQEFNGDGSHTTTKPDGSTVTEFPDGDRVTVSYDDPPEGADKMPAGDKPATGTGEPHYLTRDGVDITTQAAGEFVLVTGVAGREMQARHEPWAAREDVSAITALAFRVGDSKVEVRLNGEVLIDGEGAPEGDFVQGDLPAGGAVGVWRTGATLVNVVVIWPDLSVVWVTHGLTYMNFVVQWRAKAPEHRGLLGSNDGDPANDLLDRQNSIHAAADEAGVATFVESWRLTSEESLFTYDEGKSTSTYTLKGFPKPRKENTHEALAQECCGGLPEGPARRQCYYDVSLTGDASFAKTYEDVYRRFVTLQYHSPRTARKPAAPASIPTPESAIGLSKVEMETAIEIESTATLKETLVAGGSKVFRFQHRPGTSILAVNSNRLDKPGDTFKQGMPGYALFDDQGKSIGPARPAWNDSPSLDRPAGLFYIKLVGPGEIDIQLQ